MSKQDPQNPEEPPRRLLFFVLAAGLLLGYAAAASAECTGSSTDPYLDCAEQSYGDVLTDIQGQQGNPNYWQIGNVSDTMFDFLAMLNTPAEFTQFNSVQGTVNNCTATTLAQYLACLFPVAAQQKSGCWYDDYAWWGIASTKAFSTDPRYARIFDDGAGTAKTFQQIARTTWGILQNGKGDGIHKGAPQVWDNRENRTGFTPPPPPPVPSQLTPPRFPGGVWQYDLFTNARSTPGSPQAGWVGPLECVFSTSNPRSESLGPYQNTVVNGLYFMLAQRLLALDPANRSAYAPAVQAEYGFLRNWFGYDQGFSLPTAPGASCPGGCDNYQALLRVFPPPQKAAKSGMPALVYERVSTYAAPEGSNAPYSLVESWSPTTFWTGDQGLVLGGLIDFANANPNDDMSPVVAPMIVKGVMSQMVAADNSVAPWLGLGRAPGGDSGDYLSGTGTFMRYLLYAHNAQFAGNPIPRLAKQSQFQTFLKKAADAAYCSYPGSGSMFDHFNALATMVAARQMLTSVPTSVVCP